MTEAPYPYPRIGIGVLIFRDGKILLGQRKNKHGAGEYAPPGGKLDHGESFEDCARREVREETGMEIDNVRFLSLMNQRQYLPQHFVNLGLVADWKSGEPENLEPHKLESWGWYDPGDLPAPQFATLPSYLVAYRGGRFYFDD